jgi:MFS transporter, AAHS family, 4-hydroxybenzoate transporter
MADHFPLKQSPPIPPPTDISEIIENQKLTWFVVGLILVSWIVTFFDGFDMNVIAFVAPDMSAALHLDRSMMGKVFSAGLLGTMIGGFIFGYVGDRIGRRPSIIFTTASFGVLTLGLSQAGSYQALWILRIADGIVIGGLLPLCWALNIEYVPRRYRSTVVTLIMLGYTFGNSFGGPLTIWMAPHYGWRSVFIFGGFAAFVATGLLFLFIPESIKFLVIKNKRPDLIARYAQRLAPERAIRADDGFVLSDEIRADKFTLPLLFQNDLRWITPILWTAYIASSIAVFFRLSWEPSVFQALGFTRSTAALASSANSIGGAIGGLLLMRFTDTRGAIAVSILPVLAVPTLLVMGLTRVGGNAFLILSFFNTMFVVGAHFGIHSIAGIFYPSSYRANGAGWATSIAKIGSILGPLLGGVALSSGLPVKNMYAFLAVCPLAVGIGIFIVGKIQQRGLHKNFSRRLAEPPKPLAAQAGLRD